MLQAMFAGVSGLQAHQTRMSTIGNNIANVNTVGFKANRVNFQDQLSQLLKSATAPTTGGVGGQNAVQIGLGVEVGAVTTLQTQGNLQSTGKQSDFSIQGSGFFMVTNGKDVQFTRDGSFDLDSSGALVNTATGQRLLGYQADALGNIDTTVPVTSESQLRVPVGTLLDAKQTTKIGLLGNLNAAAALYSTKIDFTGNLDSGATSGTVEKMATAYDQLGNAHAVKITFSNPTNAVGPTPPAPAGATRAWDVKVEVDGVPTYDSTSGKSRIYQVGGSWEFADTSTGALLGGAIQLNGGSGSNQSAQIPGSGGAAAFSVDLNMGALTDNAAASSISATTDGQTGASPTWGTAMQVYDSLGVPHLITFKYTRQQLGTSPLPGATSRWDWTATVDGQVVGSSASTGNSPLYFNALGKMIGGGAQTLTIAPTNGSVSPFTITMVNTIGQLASDSSVAGDGQDGYPTGTLQSFSVGGDGIINGLFTSGQTRMLGQLALGMFSNPGGLEKIGNNTFKETPNSGAVQVGVPNKNGRGKISPGFLEMSNVDIAQEFTQIIITQRGYQANTRIISTVDELLQDVISLKR
jgi:flagellar hook protein FlgE